MEKNELAGFCDLAVELGAVDAKMLRAGQIVVKQWVRWKCHFGCDSYGKSLMCPPHSPSPEETKSLLKEYEYALLFRSKSSARRTLAVELERRIFLEGYPAALGFVSGSCRLREECNLKGGYCIRPFEARPSMESCGISVFDTARNAGYEMKVLKSKQEEDLRYGLVLIQ